MNEVLKKLGEIGIIPVIVLDDAKDAAPLAKALMEGGLPCAEVTFRTAAAADVIREMVTAYPEIFVGAGTVLTIDQANRAIEAGAKFIVSHRQPGPQSGSRSVLHQPRHRCLPRHMHTFRG